MCRVTVARLLSLCRSQEPPPAPPALAPLDSTQLPVADRRMAAASCVPLEATALRQVNAKCANEFIGQSEMYTV